MQRDSQHWLITSKGECVSSTWSTIWWRTVRFLNFQTFGQKKITWLVVSWPPQDRHELEHRIHLDDRGKQKMEVHRVIVSRKISSSSAERWSSKASSTWLWEGSRQMPLRHCLWPLCSPTWLSTHLNDHNTKVACFRSARGQAGCEEFCPHRSASTPIRS